MHGVRRLPRGDLPGMFRDGDIPVESSTRYGKRLIQYGMRRLFFERRPYEGCLGIEIVILTGETD